MYLILRILRPKKQEVTTTEEQDNIQDIISEGVEGDSHSIVERATAIIEKHLDDPDFNINVFAHEMAMSRTNLFTKLKAATGQTPNNMIITIRLKKAAYMLKNNPDLSIVEIADRTGFNSVKYFSKCFNDVYNIRPGNYRKDK